MDLRSPALRGWQDINADRFGASVDRHLMPALPVNCEVARRKPFDQRSRGDDTGVMNFRKAPPITLPIWAPIPNSNGCIPSPARRSLQTARRSDISTGQWKARSPSFDKEDGKPKTAMTPSPMILSTVSAISHRTGRQRSPSQRFHWGSVLHSDDWSIRCSRFTRSQHEGRQARRQDG
jgi:hypothetical protein